MSLLLDALQRASKDKEKAVALSSTSDVPFQPAMPALVGFPEILATPASVEARPAEVVDRGTSARPAMELTLEMEVSPSAQPEPAVGPSEIGSKAKASDEASARELVSPAPKVGPELAAAGSVAGGMSAHGRIKDTTTVAKEIRQAYSNPKGSPGRRRVLVLGVGAVVLALAMGSTLLGIWGDPTQLLLGSSTSSLTPVAVVAPTNPVAPQPSEAPTAGPATDAAEPVLQAKNEQGASPKAPTTKSVSEAPPARIPPRERNSSDVPPSSPAELVLRPANPARSSYVSKFRDPGATERAYSALVDGRLNDALQAYEQALASDQQDTDALLGLAYIAHQRGASEKAQNYYRGVLRFDPGNAVANAGLLALDAGTDATLTASRARELVQRQPDSAAALSFAGSAFVRDGLMADAEQAFARAQALEPGNPLHVYNRAIALDRLGQYQQALALYEKVSKIQVRSGEQSRAISMDVVALRISQLRNALNSPDEPKL